MKSTRSCGGIATTTDNTREPMKGVVTHVNQRTGWAAVRTEEHWYAVMEPAGGFDLAPGDILAGNLDIHEGETLRNLTQGEMQDVYIQAIHCSLEAALDLLQH